jgi:hypothetical protein
MAMGATTIAGFVNTTTPPRPAAATCRTGNCTFPLFSSLGICASCHDISSRIHSSAGNGKPLPLCEHSDYDGAPYHNYSLAYDDGQALLQGFNGKWPAGCGPAKGMTSRPGLYQTLHPSRTYNFRDQNTLLVSFAILQAPDEYALGLEEWEDLKMVGTECGLRFCGLIYNTSTQNGEFSEKVVFDGFERLPTSFRLTGDKALGMEAKIEAATGSSLFFPDQREHPSLGHVFQRTGLQLGLPHSAVGKYKGFVVSPLEVTQKTIETMGAFFRSNQTLDMVADVLSYSTNVTASFEAVARTMSNRIREIDATVVQGTSEQWVVHIRIQWGLLAGPFAVFIASVLLLIVTVRDAEKQGLGAMKEGLMDVLVHGPDNATREFLRAHDKKEHVAEIAMVRLEGMGGGQPELRGRISGSHYRKHISQQ